MAAIFNYLSFNFSRPYNHNVTIRIGSVVDEPYVTDCFDRYPKNCQRPGIETEFLYTLINDMIGFNVVWFKLQNDQVQEALDKKDIDILGFTTGLVTTFTAKWSYTKPINYDSPGFVIKKKYKSLNNKELYLLKMFTWDMWISLLFLTVVAYSLKSIPTIVSCCYFPPKTFFGIRFFIVTWFFILGIIINLFGNLIAVNLAIPNITEDLPFSSISELGDLVLEEKCKLITLNQFRNNSMFWFYFFNPDHTNTWADKFRSAYKSNPPMFVETRDEMVTVISNSNPCIIGLDFASLNHYYTNRYCRIKMIVLNYEFIPHMFVYYHQLDRFSPIFDSIINDATFLSYDDYLLKKYYFSIPMETCNNQSKIETESIPVAKIKDCFVILLVGFFVSLAIFLVHKCICNGKKLKVTDYHS